QRFIGPWLCEGNDAPEESIRPAVRFEPTQQLPNCDQGAERAPPPVSLDDIDQGDFGGEHPRRVLWFDLEYNRLGRRGPWRNAEYVGRPRHRNRERRVADPAPRPRCAFCVTHRRRERRLSALQQLR